MSLEWPLIHFKSVLLGIPLQPPLSLPGRRALVQGTKILQATGCGQKIYISIQVFYLFKMASIASYPTKLRQFSFFSILVVYTNLLVTKALCLYREMYRIFSRWIVCSRFLMVHTYQISKIWIYKKQSRILEGTKFPWQLIHNKLLNTCC